MAGQKKLHAAIVTSQKKTIINPNEEGGGAILFHSLATTAGRGEDNSISSPPTPKVPRQSRNTTALRETTLSKSADLRGY
jgi:hypothetical protein